MSRMLEARLLRASMVAGGLFCVLVVVVGAGERLGDSEQLGAVLPFLSVALVAGVLVGLRAPLDRLVERLTHYREITPYSALADAAQRLRAGSLDEALPGLARVLADGTGATQAVVWLAIDDHLLAAARHPPAADPLGPTDTADNLAVLVARPGTTHVVPVLDGAWLRAALTIDKPDAPITPADRRLMRDVANGAALLLRGVALNAELTDRVRRSDDLAAELQASRQRLSQAREVERRRLMAELTRATTEPLAALRGHILLAHGDLDHPGTGAGQVQERLTRARAELDDLLDRFRSIARGVYPALLRGQGPGAALAELAADLARPVLLTVDVEVRLPWEIESGIYHAAAAALNVLAVQAVRRELRVRLSLSGGRVGVVIEDPVPALSAADVRAALADDIERLTALGGGLECGPVQASQPEGPAGEPSALRLQAWLPDHLDPLLDGEDSEDGADESRRL